MLRQLLVLLFAALGAAHNEVLFPRSKVCYFENLRPDDDFSISFQVGSRDPNSAEQLDIDFYVTSPTGERLVDVHGVTNDKISVRIPVRGRYEYCFSNERSNNHNKDITFHLHHVWASELKTERYNTLDGQVKLLNRLLQDISNDQNYLMIRERTHRNTAESTNDRVKWWSVIQIILVAANALFQVFYLKRFFEVKSNV